MAPRLYRFLVRLSGDDDLARDLAQETLTRGWENRTSLRQPAALPTWLFRIATRTWTDHIQHLQRHRTTELSESTMPNCPRAGPAQSVETAELGERISQAMDRLPTRQRQVMHLRVIENMSMGEIAEVVGLNEHSVRSTLAAARKQLRSEMALYQAGMELRKRSDRG